MSDGATSRVAIIVAVITAIGGWGTAALTSSHLWATDDAKSIEQPCGLTPVVVDAEDAFDLVKETQNTIKAKLEAAAHNHQNPTQRNKYLHEVNSIEIDKLISRRASLEAKLKALKDKSEVCVLRNNLGA